ncbi:hypothetical protein GCM10010245_15240 [Streptomyces spectabilis]|nr:hypothetical protein GCM10010245_15240 [Streptomyces spectabilis]
MPTIVDRPTDNPDHDPGRAARRPGGRRRGAGAPRPFDDRATALGRRRHGPQATTPQPRLTATPHPPHSHANRGAAGARTGPPPAARTPPTPRPPPAHPRATITPTANTDYSERGAGTSPGVRGLAYSGRTGNSY